MRSLRVAEQTPGFVTYGGQEEEMEQDVENNEADLAGFQMRRKWETRCNLVVIY